MRFFIGEAIWLFYTVKLPSDPPSFFCFGTPIYQLYKKKFVRSHNWIATSCANSIGMGIYPVRSYDSWFRIVALSSWSHGIYFHSHLVLCQWQQEWKTMYHCDRLLLNTVMRHWKQTKHVQEAKTNVSHIAYISESI